MHPAWLTERAEYVLDDPEVDVIVEVMGGEVEAGPDRARPGPGVGVVTANKLLLARRGPALLMPPCGGTDLAFEASAGGGIPVIPAPCARR